MVKPDAPVPLAPPTEKTASGETALKRPSLPHFYSAQRNIPPLPFNPMPGLPLFDLGGNKFLYDDTAVDYFSLFAESFSSSESEGGMSAMSSMAPCNPCSTNGGGGGGGSFYSGPPAYSYASTSLWVKITSTNATNFLLDVNNTVPGTVYGVGLKSSVNADPFNTWTLAQVFSATSTNKQFDGTASQAARFFNAVNLDAYTGPSISIVSPMAGATVSNDIPLQIRVTDILPLTGVKVFVGAVQVAVLQSNQNGIVTVPTARFPNGSHQIWVLASNEGVPVDTDGDSVLDDYSPFQSAANVTVNFTNEVAMQNYSPLWSKSGSLTLQYKTTSTQDYTFEVFKTNGVLLHTASGQSVNGSISRTWNFTDLSNGAVNERSYVFSLTHSPPSGGSAAAAPPRKLLITNFVDNGVSVGKYVVSYGTWPSSYLNNLLADMNANVSSTINWAAYFNEDIIGSNREDYNAVRADFTSDPFPIRRATQTNDLTALTNALKNQFTGSWLFDGHSSGSGMIPGDDDYLDVRLTTKQLATLLGNGYGFIGGVYQLTYGTRLFSTMLTGCSAAGVFSEFPDATGTPPGVDQATDGQIKKSAFVGFSTISYTGATKMNWIIRIHFEWLDGEDYDTEITTAVWRANLAYPSVQGWGPTVFGFGFLGYNANESR